MNERLTKGTSVDQEQKLLGKFTLIICIFSVAIYIFYIWYGWKIDRYEVSVVCSIYMIGSLIALILNIKGYYSIAKAIVISTASISVVFTYHTFTIGYSVLTIFFPIALAIIYLFDFKKERKWLWVAAITSALSLIVNFLIPRFAFLKVELPAHIATQIDHVHEGVAIIITGFLLVVSIQNKNRINQSLQEKNDTIAATLSELTETRDQLIQAEKMASLGLLTAGINHEINNPLNFMVGGLENLRTIKGKNENKELEEFFFVFEEGIARISKIVNSLNHFSHYRNEEYTECDVHFIIENCLTILNHKLKNRVEVEKKYGKQAFVKGNSSQLHQVFLNIIANAEQAILNKGTIEISTEILTKINAVKVSFRDTGKGIPTHVKPKIFDPFFTTKEPGIGTGLGLSISYKIIQEHGGAIEVNSRENEGTEFCIVLPRAT